MKAGRFKTELRKTSPIFLGLGLFVALGLVWTVAVVLPDGIDWRKTYRPAALALLSLDNPYEVEVSRDAPFAAAAWGLIPLIPIALLPENVGRAVLLLISLVAFAYTSKKLGANLAGTAFFLLSPPVVHCLLNSNIEWIPLLGFILPPQIGLFFILVKPQTGFVVAIYWFFEAWRDGGFRTVLRTFLPVSVILVLSFALFGLWPFRATNVLTIAESFNASLWPASIPVGLALLVASIRRKQPKWAMAASPCLSPYVLFHSWSSSLVALSSNTLELAVAVIGLWLVVIMKLI